MRCARRAEVADGAAAAVAFAVLTLAHPRNEADDILATLTARARRPVVLVSRDKDLRQLLRPGVEMYDGVAGPASVRLDADGFRVRIGGYLWPGRALA